MPLHAINIRGMPSIDIRVTSSVQNYSLLAEYPLIPTSDPVEIGFTIESGVVIDSLNATLPALSFAGLHADTRIVVFNEGSILGAGGNGGNGGWVRWVADVPVFGEEYWGGGGGGAGSEVGLGGPIYFDPAEGAETAGVDGLTSTGGAGGSSDGDFPVGAASPRRDDGTSGQQGGTAIFTPCDLRIVNANGSIHGGGGGGAPGWGGRTSSGFPPLEDGQAGGDVGLPGTDSPALGAPSVGGAAGYYVYHTGVAPTFISGGSSPNVEGLLGP